MKIVFILRGFVNGGIERRVVNLANEFAACGHIVEIAAFQGECFTPAFGAADNVTFYLSGKTVKPQAPEKAADPSGSNKVESSASALSEGLKKPKKSIKRLIKATNDSDEAKFYLFHHYFQEIQNCILKVIRSTQKNVTFNGEQLVDLMKKEDHNTLAVLNKN